MDDFNGGQEARTNLIVNYLPQNLTDEEFTKIFIVVGPLKSTKIMKDLQTNYSFGFGFVEYMNPEDAAKAILTLNNFQVQHKRIKVSYARPPGEDIKETNLYIQNIPRDYNLDDLEAIFSPFGQIVQKNLLKDKTTGMARGVGFVRFDKKLEADLAISQMNGVIPQGGREPLLVKVAEEHGKMKAAYYAGFQAGLHGTKRGGQGSRGRGGVAGPSMDSGYGENFNYGYNAAMGKTYSEKANMRFNPLNSAGAAGFNGYGGVGQWSGGRGGRGGGVRGGWATRMLSRGGGAMSGGMMGSGMMGYQGGEYGDATSYVENPYWVE